MNKQMFRATLLLAFLLGQFSVALGTQVPRTARNNVQPQWSDDGEQFWYVNQLPNDQVEYNVVDANKGTKTVIDGTKAANAFSKKLNQTVQPRQLRFESVQLGNNLETVFVSRGGNWYQLNLDSYQLTDDSTQRKVSPFFLPPTKSINLGGETEIQVSNQLSDSIQLFWIDREGEPVAYQKVASGESIQQHTFFGHVWLVKSGNQTLTALKATSSQTSFIIDEETSTRVINKKRKAVSTRPPRFRFRRQTQSPNGKWRALVDRHNLFLKGNDDKMVELTTDANRENSFTADSSRARLVQMQYQRRDQPQSRPTAFWSNDSKFLLAVQTKKVDEPRVSYVESGPNDQLQPKLHSYPYAKPGDPIPTLTFRLFDVENAKEIKYDTSLMESPFQLRIVHWSDDGKHIYFHFNERGHQTIRLLKLSTQDGSVEVVIEEESETFIHYSDSGKNVMRPLGGQEVLWASERTGWNHLYRYNFETGSLVNAVTSGAWNVKRIQNIDLKNKKVWFYAVGLHEDQDPYHEHFCSVNLDGTNFQILTQGDGNHEVSFSPDRTKIVDRYSRVDMPTVTELRDATTGKLVCALEKGELVSSDTASRLLPKRFVAKGRDGKTDIYGIIHFPKNFNVQKRYPVVENIYAGPHDYHVPKAYGNRYYHQRKLADEGMIVVQIDGMGTAWRSKAFHDVCFKNLRDAGFPDRIAWMRSAAKVYPQMDIDRVGIYGGSAGGQNAMAAVLWHHDFYDVAVADCGCHDNRMDKIWWNEQWMGWPVDESYAENSNAENAKLLQGNLMLTVGELDRNVDPSSTVQVVGKLIQADKDFEFVLIPGAGHGAGESRWASRKRTEFLKRHLGIE